jgi:hypothetical protein
MSRLLLLLAAAALLCHTTQAQTHTTPPRVDTVIASSPCCLTTSAGGLAWCPRSGVDTSSGAPIMLTFIGANFGASGARVPTVCVAATVVHLAAGGTTLSCQLAPLTAAAAPHVAATFVRVIRSGGTESTSGDVAVSYADVEEAAPLNPNAPTLQRIDATGGCFGDSGGGLAFCPPTSGTGAADAVVTLTFRGTNFGSGPGAAVSVRDACADEPTRVSETMLTCRLRIRAPYVTIGASVTTPLGTSATLRIAFSGPITTCSDGARNGDELGVDCGGSCAAACPCAAGAVCAPPTLASIIVEQSVVDGTKCLPFLTGLSYCPLVGGVVVTITGNGFDDDTTVNDICAASPPLTLVSPTELTCTLAAQAATTATQQRTYSVRASNGVGASTNAVNVHFGVNETCFDGVQNGGESGVDCGGACLACATGGGGAVTGPNVVALTRIEASGGCAVFGNGLINCPPSALAASFTPIILTLHGTNFGFAGATVLPASLCAFPPVHVLGSQFVALTCQLAAAAANSAVSAQVVTAAGATTQSVSVAYGTADTSCFDGQLNGAESGIDCGGVCAACTVAPLLASVASDGCLNWQGGLVYCPTAGGVTVTLTGQHFTADTQAPLLCAGDGLLQLSVAAPSSLATCPLRR